METVHVRPGPIDIVLIVVTGVLGYVQGQTWTALLCALLMAVAIGVWRAVFILGKLLEHQQAAAYEDDEA